MTVTSTQISHRGHWEAAVSQTCVLAPRIRLQIIKNKQVGQREPLAYPLESVPVDRENPAK